MTYRLPHGHIAFQWQHFVQAFQDLSDPMMLKVCKGITIESYLANQVVCEEDEPGDSMFIVLSGQCTVRALPPPDKSADSMAHGFAIPPAGVPPRGGPGTVKSVRRVKVATTDKVCPRLLQCKGGWRQTDQGILHDVAVGSEAQLLGRSQPLFGITFVGIIH